MEAEHICCAMADKKSATGAAYSVFVDSRFRTHEILTPVLPEYND